LPFVLGLRLVYVYALSPVCCFSKQTHEIRIMVLTSQAPPSCLLHGSPKRCAGQNRTSHTYKLRQDQPSSISTCSNWRAYNEKFNEGLQRAEPSSLSPRFGGVRKRDLQPTIMNRYNNSQSVPLTGDDFHARAPSCVHVET
jgi:hypothetical protein